MKPADARVPWQDGVLQEFNKLDRWFAGRFATELTPSDEHISARSLLDPDRLRQLINRSVSSTSTPSEENPAELGDARVDMDLGVATSRFARHYAGSLTTVALVGLSHGVGFDLSVDRCTMIVRNNVAWSVVLDLPDDEILRCADRAAAWDVSGPIVDSMAELREHTWRKLYAEHLWPVLKLAAEVGKLSPNVIWTNAAEWLGTVSSAAVEYLDPKEAKPYVTESEALFDAPRLPGVPSDANPLAGKIEVHPGDGKGFPETVRSRKFCCLTYLLSDRFGRLCGNCPYLPLPDQIALIRERHGVPMGTPGGAAEQASIKTGLARPSARRARATTRTHE